MTKVFLDHGDHGHFLTMALNVLVDRASIITDRAFFDFWQYDQIKNNFVFDWEYKNWGYKQTFVPKDYENKKFIWIVRDDPVLWAYNLCTRGVLGGDKDFEKYKKGITIEEFEKDPLRWAPGCDITRMTALGKIKRKPNGNIHKKSLRSWYKKFIFNEYWLRQKTPNGAIAFNMTSFYDINLFKDSLKKIESTLGLDFNWQKVHTLYETLHNTLSYDKHTAYNKPTTLLETYQMSFGKTA